MPSNKPFANAYKKILRKGAELSHNPVGIMFAPVWVPAFGVGIAGTAAAQATMWAGYGAVFIGANAIYWPCRSANLGGRKIIHTTMVAVSDYKIYHAKKMAKSAAKNNKNHHGLHGLFKKHKKREPEEQVNMRNNVYVWRAIRT